MKEKNKVLFDPGYAPLVMESIGQVGYVYYMFGAIKDFKLKKLNFPNTARKIEKLIKTNIAFYLGCLMWGAYIANIKNHEIEGNKLLGEVCSQEEYTSEINFLIEFCEVQFNKDYKYFSGKSFEFPKEYIIILKTYKDFLILNEGFVSCSNTDMIKLPENIKTELNFEEIKSRIDEAIEKRQIEILLDSFGLIF